MCNSLFKKNHSNIEATIDMSSHNFKSILDYCFIFILCPLNNCQINNSLTIKERKRYKLRLKNIKKIKNNVILFYY